MRLKPAISIAQYNLESADKHLDEMQARFLLLARFRKMGVAREDLAPVLRSFPVDQYLIFYRRPGADPCGDRAITTPPVPGRVAGRLAADDRARSPSQMLTASSADP
jgi:plasmid stabilization system protein ParE